MTGLASVGNCALEFEKDLSPIQPVAQVPHRQQNRAGLGHGREVPEPSEVHREIPDSSYVPERGRLDV